MLKRLSETGACLCAMLALMSSPAWGQEISENLRQLHLAFEVGLFAHSPPELTLRAGLQRAAWQAQFEATRSLDESPALHLALSQSLKHVDWRASIETSWEMDAESSHYSVQLGLERRGAFGQLAGSVQFSPPDLTWTLQGSLQGTGWNLTIAQLRWQDDQWALQGAELIWILSQPLIVKVGFDSTKDWPLQLGLIWNFSLKEELSWMGRFALEGSFRWREMEVMFRRGPFSLGSSLSPSGWQEAWVEAQRALGSDLEGRGRVRWGPSGWLGTQLGGRWHDLRRNSAQATLNLLPVPASWTVQLEASKLDADFHLQGKLGLGPQGVANAMLLGRATYDVALLNGSFNYTGKLWLLDLSGSVSSELGELSGSSSWISSTGWNKGLLSLARSWELFKDH